MYGLGESWDTCRPAGFLSKKFMSTQHNYHTHKHESLAVLEALMKWEDKLLGRKFTVVTDHKGIEYFKNDNTIASRSSNNGKLLLMLIEKEFDLNKFIMKCYQQDKIYSKILENPKAHTRFGINKD